MLGMKFFSFSVTQVTPKKEKNVMVSIISPKTTRRGKNRWRKYTPYKRCDIKSYDVQGDTTTIPAYNLFKLKVSHSYIFTFYSLLIGKFQIIDVPALTPA